MPIFATMYPGALTQTTSRTAEKTRRTRCGRPGWDEWPVGCTPPSWNREVLASRYGMERSLAMVDCSTVWRNDCGPVTKGMEERRGCVRLRREGSDIESITTVLALSQIFNRAVLYRKGEGDENENENLAASQGMMPSTPYRSSCTDPGIASGSIHALFEVCSSPCRHSAL